MMETAARQALEEEFNARMYELYTDAQKCGYNAIAFLTMVRERGGLAAAQHCLGEVTDGFSKLWEMGRLDLSVEYAVLQPRWAELFTAAELATARQRLKDARAEHLVVQAEGVSQ